MTDLMDHKNVPRSDHSQNWEVGKVQIGVWSLQDNLLYPALLSDMLSSKFVFPTPVALISPSYSLSKTLSSQILHEYQYNLEGSFVILKGAKTWNTKA